MKKMYTFNPSENITNWKRIFKYNLLKLVQSLYKSNNYVDLCNYKFQMTQRLNMYAKELGEFVEQSGK